MKNNYLKKHKAIWLTWHRATRTENLAFELKVPVFAKQIDNRFLRYLLSPCWSVWVLIRERPDIIYLHYSFMLLLIVGMYKKIHNNNVVVVNDCHTQALRREMNGILDVVFKSLKKFGFNKSDVCIIHNSGMIKDIKPFHSNYIILPDKIPEYNYENIETEEKYCVYVSSFGPDEPVEEIFELANLLEGKFNIYWTGKPSQFVKKKVSSYCNLHLTGHLEFQSYLNLIGNADCILALTYEEGCLQSAAYEALNVETPLVLTDTKALKSYFNGAAYYTKLDPYSIAENIQAASKHRKKMKKKIKQVKVQRDKEFKEKFSMLRSMVQDSIRKKL